MKHCLVCRSRFSSQTIVCPSCGFGPEVLAGIDAYAPDLAYGGGGGFKADYFSELAHLEELNFWFQARNKLILWALSKYCQKFQSFLEIGCGTGYVLSGISNNFPNVILTGSEIFMTGLGFAANRLPSTKFIQMDARNIPYAEEFDVIGAFDVLEHIEEDELVLAQIHSALKPQGHVLLTVPQHAWLWSPVDEYACHVRRYGAADIYKKIEMAGFQVVRSTSFITALLPAMAVSRLLQKQTASANFDATTEFKIAPWLNAVLFQLLSVERGMIRAGINFPMGGSRLVVAKKS